MYGSERIVFKQLGNRLFMFRTRRIRWHNPVWVCKLADVVTSLCLGLLCCLKSYSMWHLYLGIIKQHHNWNKWGHESVNRSLTLINQLLPWKRKGTELYNNKWQISTIIFKLLHWHPIRSSSSDDPQEKIWSSASELKWTVLKVNCELWWIVKSDRQFCGTVYVISWTVALILSSRKIVNFENVFVSFQYCW